MEKNISFEYFIIMNGMRPENYSKKGNGTGWGTHHFLSALENINKNFKVTSILLDNDAPLEKQSELVAKYMNQLKENKNCKRIHVLGISKCGTMAVALLKYLSNSNLEELNIIVYSSPYLGTIFASPVLLYQKLDAVIEKLQIRVIKNIIPYLKKIKPFPIESTGSFHKILQNCNISKKILKYQATQLIKIMLIVYLINYHIKFIYFKNIEKLMFKCKYYKIVIFYEMTL